MKRIQYFSVCVTSILFLYAAGRSNALPLRYCVNPETARRLLQWETLSGTSAKDQALSLLPDCAAAAIIRQAMQAHKPDIIVETAALLPRSPRQNTNDETLEREILAMYNTLCAVSSLQGIEYYSASSKKMKILYETSSLVSGPDGSTRLPDTFFDALPAAPQTVYARQKDGSFGDNIYKLEMRTKDNAVLETSTNVHKMKYGIITVAQPGEMQGHIMFISLDEGILFYAATGVKTAVSPGLIRGKLETSFSNRAEALFVWFSKKMKEAWDV